MPKIDPMSEDAEHRDTSKSEGLTRTAFIEQLARLIALEYRRLLRQNQPADTSPSCELTGKKPSTVEDEGRG
jgi:hypothetical protein